MASQKGQEYVCQDTKEKSKSGTHTASWIFNPYWSFLLSIQMCRVFPHLTSHLLALSQLWYHFPVLLRSKTTVKNSPYFQLPFQFFLKPVPNRFLCCHTHKKIKINIIKRQNSTRHDSKPLVSHQKWEDCPKFKSLDDLMFNIAISKTGRGKG